MAPPDSHRMPGNADSSCREPDTILSEPTSGDTSTGPRSTVSEETQPSTASDVSQLDLGTIDRIFPIRSIFSVAPSITLRPSFTRTVSTPAQPADADKESAQIHEKELPRPEESSLPVYPQEITEADINEQEQRVQAHGVSNELSTVTIPLDTLRKPEENEIMDTAPEKTLPDAAEECVTARFTHMVTDKGDVVVTGRDNSSFERCEDEPIHTPGAVQGFGALLALREETPGKLVVRVASENSEMILGYSPNALFNVDNFCDLIGADHLDTFLDHVDFVREETWDPLVEGPEVSILSITQPDNTPRRFWCATHVHKSSPDLIICEFELENDRLNPLNVSGETLPLLPTSTLGFEPTPEEVAASTSNASRPLRILRNARRKQGEAAAMEVFSILSQIEQQLAQAESLEVLLNRTIGLIKELTGFHRVMIYQFDPSWNGLVVAELVDPRATNDFYKGLRFPASDIPKQARDLYKINKVRLLYDRDQPTARLVCRTLEDFAVPLDMTHSCLRAMSPIHIKYLANMAVRASMSISINAFNELWGLISLHSYGESGMRVSFPLRRMCRLIGSAISRNIERLSYTSRLQARKLINTVPTEANPRGYIVASSEDLLRLFGADFGAVSIRGETKILGKPAVSQEVLAFVEYLRMRELTSVTSSHNITRDYPDLRYPPGFKTIAGLLYAPLSISGSDFIVFFRRPQITEIKWGGNPYEKQIKAGTVGYLEPRKSFQTWRELVVDQSREWSENDIDTAAILCLVYGKFIRVWRQREAAMERSHLTKLLLANSAHEVRTPLNAIINYLEIAMENPLDQDTRDNLMKSHSASKSLIYVINDLLDLTQSEPGRSLIKDEYFDFPSAINEATEVFETEAKRKGIEYTVTVRPGIPKLVLGDQRRLRQAIVNLIANAIQHTSTGSVTVDFSRLPQTEAGMAYVEITVLDSGCGMSQETLETLFHDLEQVSTDDDDQFEDDAQTEKLLRSVSPKNAETGKRVLGLGLAQVARLVRFLNGQLSVKSVKRKGTLFKLLLQLPVSEAEAAKKQDPDTGDIPTSPPTTPLDTEGEFMLVKTKSSSPQSVVQRHVSEQDSAGIDATLSSADKFLNLILPPTRKSGEEAGLPAPQALERESETIGSEPVASEPCEIKECLPQQLTEEFDPLKQQSSSSIPTTVSVEPAQTAIADISALLNAAKISTQDTTELSIPSEKPLSETELSPFASPTFSAYGRIPYALTLSSAASLSVLVAEDDPINSKIVKKRLEKFGHAVHLTVNGEECFTAFASNPRSFDVVLMDIQMPIVDGTTSTRMIRKFERTNPDTITLSEKAKKLGRIPIFAVSASLVEKDMHKYVETGFDGWIMKPIDFNQTNIILDGISEQKARESTSFQPGMWEKGGWFLSPAAPSSSGD